MYSVFPDGIACQNAERFSLRLVPTVKLLTPPLVSGKLYEVRLWGRYYYEPGGFGSNQNAADALHIFRNYKRPERYNSVWIGHSLPDRLDAWQENPPMSEYSGVLEGTGEQICVSVGTPSDFFSLISGAINMWVQPVDDDHPLLVARKRRERERDEAEIRAEVRQELADRKKRNEELSRQIEDLKRVVRANRNILDAEYRTALVSQKNHQILADFRPVWQAEREQLFQNVELMELLKDQAPDVIAFYETRSEIIFEAERYAVLHPPAPWLPPRREKSYYETLMEQANTGDKLVLSPLQDRAKDLFGEKTILEAQRRAAVRNKRVSEVRDYDQRLIVVRREITTITTTIEKLGGSVEFKRSQEPEQSIEEAFFKDYEAEKRIVQQLELSGDLQTKEAVQGLYAERRLKLFQQDTESY